MSTIAVIGLGGFLGAPVLDALQSSTFADKIKYPVLAVTRDDSKYTSNDKIKYVKGDFTTETDRLAQELAGVDTIVELIVADPVLFAATEKLVLKVKPKLFLPSSFGDDVNQSQQVFPGFLQVKLDHSKVVRDAGIKTVDIATGLFGTPESIVDVLAPALGSDAESKTVTYYGTPSTKISYSVLEDIGNVVAAVSTSEPSKLPDVLRVNSGRITLEELFKKYAAKKGVKFDAEEVSPEDALAEGKETWAKGFNPSIFIYYLKVIISQGPEKGLWFTKTDNELVNPGESLWKWTIV